MAFRREVKVGAFVLAGLTAIGAVIFLIGDERQLFLKKEVYRAQFEDVQGLRRGSPVRMGGVDVGTVLQVDYGADAKDQKIHVSMAVVTDEARRIRSDSVATIEGKGLLGDKMIVITVGTPGKAQLPEGSQIPSREAEDVSQVMSRLGTISSQVEKVVNNLERTTDSLSDQSFHDDLKSSMASLSHILGAVDRGEGVVGRAFHDREQAERVAQMLASTQHLVSELDRSAMHVNAVLEQVHSGPGLAHEVLYGEDGARALARLAGVATELETTLKGIREGNGLVKGLLYGDESSGKVVANLEQMSSDLKEIVGGVRAGRGTLGALLADPSVYEDLKLLLGNVERNKALRALVRYSIRKDERAADPPDRSGSRPAAPEEARAGASAPGTKADVSGN